MGAKDGLLAFGNFITKLKKSTFFLGSVFFTLSVFSFLALVSYTSLDESFNVISKYPVQNIMGRAGSYFADFALQYFGLSSFFTPFWTGLVSYDFFSRGITSLKNRFLGFIAALFALGLILSFLKPYTYYFEYPLGGYLMTDVLSSISNIYAQVIIFAIVLFVAILSVLYSCEKTEYLSIVSVKGFQKDGGTKNLEVRLKKNGEASFVNLDNNLLKSNKIHQDSNNTQALNADSLAYHDANLQFLDLNSQANKPADIKSKLTNNSITVYKAPPYDILNMQAQDQQLKTIENINDAKLTKDKLLACLMDFGVGGRIVSIQVGPVISVFEFEPESGIRASRVMGLNEDVARYLKAPSCRISQLNTKGALGIEVPNRIRETVFLREIFETQEYKDTSNTLPITFGKTMDGVVFLADLSKMPHLLIAGTTGSGKSVGINAIIMSLLFRLSPEDCKFIMIDPKMLELSVYDGIPHLLMPVITDAKNAVMALKWVLDEMEARYRKMSKIGVRNIAGYNAKIKANPSSGLDKIPFIIVVVDEMADLMIVSGKAVEASIQRLSQMARAAGIHLILATQRPSVDVITGVIKANMPTRLSFQVTSGIDSRTILGSPGAEQLLGMGDMLFMPAGTKMIRLHAPFVADSEVASAVDFLKSHNPEPIYVDLFTATSSGDTIPEQGFTRREEKLENQMFMGSKGIFDDFEPEVQDSDDAIYNKAVAVVVEERRTSISYIQRRLRIGFNKAAGMIERMEQDGLLGKPDDKGRRIINEEWIVKYKEQK